MNRLASLVVAASFAGGLPHVFAGPESLPAPDYKAAAAPVVVKECKWTGFYIGGSLGHAWGDNSFKGEDETDPALNFDQAGFIGGGQVGFNWQPCSFLVLGVE